MSEIQGRVKKLSIDQDKGEVYGFVLDGTEGYFNYSLPKYRAKPWDEHPVGSIIKVEYATADNGKRYVKSIERCDGETEPPWLSEEDGPAHTAIKERKAEVVKEVLAGEQEREHNLDRRKAMECAAQVVVAYVMAYGAKSLEVERETIAEFIDLVLDKFLAATK